MKEFASSMMDLGPHAIYIWASYGAVALSLGALIVWIVMDGRAQRRRLSALQAQGVTRRGRGRGVASNRTTS